MEITDFWTICSTNGIVLSLEQLEQFKRYQSELIYWNEKVNLVSRKDEEHILEYHILHSLSAIKYIDTRKKSKCMDLGTGGGLPGIPISIVLPENEMVLIDSIKKKMTITSMLANHTGIKSLSAICARAEELHNDNKFKFHFDYIFSRGVGKILQIIDWSEPLLSKNGKIILYKGGNLDEEINEAKYYYSTLIIEENLIKMQGINKFEKDEKKILICSFK